MRDDEAAYCADQVRRLDRERWLMALVAPEAARRGLLALYAFHGEIARIRETVREPHMGLLRLQWWRDVLVEAAAGAPRRHPVVLELQPLLADGRLPVAELIAMIDARERDMDDALPPDLAALESYGRATAGALARLTLRLFGAPEPRHEDAAAAVGAAWALTGLLRAAPFHAATRRCHLPADLVTASGLDLEAWFAGRGGATAAPIVERVAGRARELLAEARRHGLPRRGFAAVAPAVLVPAHLRRLERAGHDPFAASVQAPLPSTALRLALGRWFLDW